MKALIHNNTVVQLEESEFPVAGGLTWMDAPAGCAVGWILEGGELIQKPEHVKTTEEMITEMQHAVKEHLSLIARQKDYDNENSIMTYVDSGNTTWAAEAQSYSDWRDSVWVYVLEQLSLFESSSREIVTVDEFIAELPAITWPQ